MPIFDDALLPARLLQSARAVRPLLPRLAILFLCVLAPLWVIGEIAEEISETHALPFDVAILRFMQASATPLLDRLMLALSTLGSGPWIASFDVALFLWLLARRRTLDALFWAAATGGAALLNVAAKHGYGRVRPDLWVSIAPETSFSFPSGHTMQTMAVATALVVLAWHTRARWPVLAAGIALTGSVGLSRVYLGVHFPTDVIAGWLASLAWVIGLGFAFYRHPVRRPRRTGPAAASPFTRSAAADARRGTAPEPAPARGRDRASGGSR